MALSQNLGGFLKHVYLSLVYRLLTCWILKWHLHRLLELSTYCSFLLWHCHLRSHYFGVPDHLALSFQSGWFVHSSSFVLPVISAWNPWRQGAWTISVHFICFSYLRNYSPPVSNVQRLENIVSYIVFFLIFFFFSFSLFSFLLPSFLSSFHSFFFLYSFLVSFFVVILGACISLLF